MDMTRKAPNPISRQEQLTQVCTVYICLVPYVKQLITFIYGTEWVLCKEEVTFPDPTEDGQWPTTKILTDWLNNDAKDSSYNAHSCNDFSQAFHCVQGGKEVVPEFIQRFIMVWDGNAGTKREDNDLFAIQTFLKNLQLHIATAYKLSFADWHNKNLKTTINKTMVLHRNQLKHSMLMIC